MRKTPEILERREKAIEAAAKSPLLFTVKNDAIENPDATNAILTPVEYVCLSVLITERVPLSAHNIWQLYVEFKRAAGRQLIYQSVKSQTHITKIPIINKDIFVDSPAWRVAPFKFSNNAMISYKPHVNNILDRFEREEKAGKRNKERNRFYIFWDNPEAYEAVAEEVLHLKIPSYPKIKQSMENLKFLSFVYDRPSTSSNSAVLYYLNPLFISNYEKRKLELAEKLRKKELALTDIDSKLASFYQLYTAKIPEFGISNFRKQMEEIDMPFSLGIGDYLYMKWFRKTYDNERR